MLQRSPTGLLLIFGRVILVAIGVLVWSGALPWFGHLPGDIRIERQDFRFYAPISSMVILSILFTVIAALIRRFRQ